MNQEAGDRMAAGREGGIAEFRVMSMDHASARGRRLRRLNEDEVVGTLRPQERLGHDVLSTEGEKPVVTLEIPRTMRECR
jgi:hypothetical protein